MATGTKMREVFPRDRFLWAVGIEDTFVPHAKEGMRSLDEYELTQHYQFWREDLERAAALGVGMIRWGVPWYRVETQPGVFDWTWVDQVFDHMDKLGLQPIVDLVHYGTPLWLEDSFASDEYPQLVERFSRAFTKRYKHRIRYYTPLNEPTVNADFSGRRAEWPPYLEGDRGYVKVLLQIAKGMQLSVRAIREEHPEAVIFAVEAMNFHRAETAAAVLPANLRYMQDLLAFDLVCGRVMNGHPLLGWLMDQGMTIPDVAELYLNRVEFDVFGVNFYPWSSHKVTVGADGEARVERGPDDGRSIIDVFRRVHKHVNLPIFVTETSAVDHRRADWMGAIWDGIRLARLDDIPVVGLTWFPLFTMINWDYRLSKKPIDEHLLDLGLVEARFNQRRELERRNLELFDAFREMMRKPLPDLSPDFIETEEPAEPCTADRHPDCDGIWHHIRCAFKRWFGRS